MRNNYTMKTFLPYSSGADAIVTYYESLDAIMKFFSVCYQELYNQLVAQKDEDTIYLEYDNILYNYYPRFSIEKIK